MRRYLIPLIFGLGGFAVLVSLGIWQLQRLAWKEAILADIDARITASPVAVPAAPDATEDRYLPVTAKGDLLGTPLRVLVSTKERGAGYRLVTRFVLEDGRQVMVDEGFVELEENAAPGDAEGVTVAGNLHWPEEVDSWTPEPDLSGGLFYARDVATMAGALGTEPVLIVARTVTGTDPRATPMPVTSTGVPNNHLGYAVQWFGLAAVWLGMTAFLLWRIRKRTV
ncbi:SURF1 family protein [Silicimonas sp. MF1-12-2]|uniref:SURF1 family protein n=1 Tax=Silicimonas sp. MF1-12-2 TaxID=3384793 RepID=UPI0039B66920